MLKSYANFYSNYRKSSRNTRPSFPGHQKCAARPQFSRAILHVHALDAAFPFDSESRAREQLTRQKKQKNMLKIGIVGFGNFGQFLAKRLVQAGHQVIATSRRDYSASARAIGATYYADVHDFCEEHPHVVVLASSILSIKHVLNNLPVQRLKRSTLIVDVLSVKVFPKQLMLNMLPRELDVLCTHPMFGPDSGSGSWEGLNFMYEKVRISNTAERQHRAQTFIDFFKSEGCKMVDITCEEHDRQAASTQFITHTVGRILGGMHAQTTDINTTGYDSLLQLVQNTTNDSFELYYGLFLYNQNSLEELTRLEHSFGEVKKQLFSRLHAIAQEQMLPIPSGTDTDTESTVTQQQALPPPPPAAG